MLKAAWHWGSDSSVINDTLGERGRTHFYVGLPSAGGSVDDDLRFSPYFVEEPLNWGLLRDING